MIHAFRQWRAAVTSWRNRRILTFRLGATVFAKIVPASKRRYLFEGAKWYNCFYRSLNNDHDIDTIYLIKNARTFIFILNIFLYWYIEQCALNRFAKFPSRAEISRIESEMRRKNEMENTAECSRGQWRVLAVKASRDAEQASTSLALTMKRARQWRSLGACAFLSRLAVAPPSRDPDGAADEARSRPR